MAEFLKGAGAAATATAGIGAVSAGTAVASSGTLSFADGGGVSWGINGQTITATAAGGGGGGVALSAGTQSVQTGTVIFYSASNNVTFGMSGSSRITASIPGGATATGNFGGISAGTQAATSGTVVFSNSNNVSFGMSGSTQVTASIPSGATATGNLGGLAAGTQTATSGSVVFSNSNGLTFGMSNSSQMTASMDAVRSISAGTSNATGSQIVFSNSNNISFGANAGTVTATWDPSPTLSWFRPLGGEGWLTATGSQGIGTSQSTLWVFPLTPKGPFPGLLTVNTLMLGISGSQTNTAASSTSGNFSWSFGLYTVNGANLSLLNTVSGSFNISSGSDCTAGLHGPRWLTAVSSEWSVQPTLSITSYYGALWFASGNTSKSLSWLGQPAMGSAQRSGIMGASAATATSQGWHPWMGVYSAQTSAFPAAIHHTDVSKGDTVGFNIPDIVFNALTASF